jgi:hypothetical protein
VCEGHRTTPCECCGEDTDCERCQATGLDPLKVDLRALKQAVLEHWKRHGGSMWGLEEDGLVVGHCGGPFPNVVWTLRFADFARGKPASGGAGGEAPAKADGRSGGGQ